LVFYFYEILLLKISLKEFERQYLQIKNKQLSIFSGKFHPGLGMTRKKRSPATSPSF